MKVGFIGAGRMGIVGNFYSPFVIVAKGDHLVIEFNGTKIIDRTDPAFAKKGVIALQLHAGPPMEVMFKDIEIKEIK